MNSINLMGRLVRDVELRYTASEKPVATFTMAVDKGGDGADFIPCVAWEKKATFIDQYFHKGDMIAVSGRVQSRSYDAKDGGKRTVLEVVVDRAYFTGAKKQSEEPAYDVPKPAQSFKEVDEEDGELPF